MNLQKRKMNKSLPLHPGAHPCVNSGWCCKKGPCAFGTWDKEQKRCVHLTTNNLCGIYDLITALPQEQWEWNPAFGAGCCASLNPDRQKILSSKKKKT